MSKQHFPTAHTQSLTSPLSKTSVQFIATIIYVSKDIIVANMQDKSYLHSEIIMYNCLVILCTLAGLLLKIASATGLLDFVNL